MAGRGRSLSGTAGGRVRAGRQPRKAETTHIGALVEYSITGLFGQRRFGFKLDPVEPTLLTGVNGTGKSTILRTIDAISTGRFQDLVGVPFETITLSFDSGFALRIASVPDGLQIEAPNVKPWLYRDYRGKHVVPNWRNFSVHFNETTRAELIQRYGNDESVRYLSRSAGIPLEEAAYQLFIGGEDLQDLPDWLEGFEDRFPVLFITDQRLVVDPGPDRSAKARETPTKIAVEEAASDVARRIADAQARYADRSQRLDRDFPQRIIAAMERPVEMPDHDFVERIERLARRREKLEATGLLPVEATQGFAAVNLSEEVRTVIATYFDDTYEKLSVLEPLSDRLESFTNFLNQHYRDKQVVIDTDRGFAVRTRGGAEMLSPSKLSSGEQQMMVLAHRILFGAREGTLVLIDEPELSLHVIWQRTFIDDLTRMGQVARLSFLLATHSPTLIGGRDDLKRSLDEMSES